MFFPDEIENKWIDFDNSYFICLLWINTWCTLTFNRRLHQLDNIISVNGFAKNKEKKITHKNITSV